MAFARGAFVWYWEVFVWRGPDTPFAGPALEGVFWGQCGLGGVGDSIRGGGCAEGFVKHVLVLSATGIGYGVEDRWMEIGKPQAGCALSPIPCGVHTAVIKSLRNFIVAICQNIRVILFSIHNDDGNPSSVIIKQHCGRSTVIATIRASKTIKTMTKAQSQDRKEKEQALQQIRRQRPRTLKLKPINAIFTDLIRSVSMELTWGEDRILLASILLEVSSSKEARSRGQDRHCVGGLFPIAVEFIEFLRTKEARSLRRCHKVVRLGINPMIQPEPEDLPKDNPKLEIAVLSGMEHGFLSQKGSGGRRGVKEKSLNRNSINTSSGISVSTESDDTMNEDTPCGVASTVKEGVTPSVVDMMVEKEKISSFEDTTVPKSFPPLNKPVSTTASNALGKYGLVRSMFSSSTGLFSFQFSSMDGLDAMFENGLWFIRNNLLIMKKWHPDENLLKEDVSTPLMLDSYTSDMCMQSWGRSSYARVMIELRADVELIDNIVVAMPKITREGHYTCDVYVEYKWKPTRCSSCKVFGHIHEECPKNTGVGEKKTVKKPSQTYQGVLVGPKIGFKPKKEYRLVPKKPNSSSSGNKKKGMEPTIEWILFMNVDNNEELASNTPIGKKIDKIEQQICEGKLRRWNSGIGVGRGKRGRRPREGNDEHVDDLNGQGNDQGMGANGGVEGVNGNVEGANGGALEFSMIISQQLQNLLPAMLAQISNRGNVWKQMVNVVNENVQENVGNVIVNGNRLGCSYKEFLACNPKEYDGKGGVVVLTRWIEKMESVHDMWL
ncbi:zinc finger, CCHC-type containing protein [Tanacetum coccineum]